MNINIITLGCSKNTVDSEVLAAQFLHRGDHVFHNGETEDVMDIAIINTCSFIQDAKAQAIEEILYQVERKKHGLVKKVFVIGCLAQRYENDLRESIPELDGIFTFDKLNLMLDVPKFDLLGQSERIVSTPPHYAYLKVSEGCDRQCSYCAIPLIRGKQVSKPVELLVKDATTLAENGVK